jgi:hypothetical protein
MWVIGNINSTSEPSILLYVSRNYALTHDNATLHFYTGKKVEHKNCLHPFATHEDCSMLLSGLPQDDR